MSITTEIIQATNETLQLEPTNANYQCFNTGGVETQVGEFLYGLVRMMQPEKILETGTHLGIASSYMGLALRENHKGILDTIEYENLNLTIAKDRWNRLGIKTWIDEYLMSSLEFQPKTNYQIILLDTEPNIRFQEFERYFPYLESGGIIMIHDLHPHMSQVQLPNQEFAWPFGKLPEFIKNKILDHEIQSFHFKTPRGLWIAQKSSPEFYSTKILNG